MPRDCIPALRFKALTRFNTTRLRFDDTLADWVVVSSLFRQAFVYRDANLRCGRGF